MDKYQSLKLDNQLCFPLYAASREVIKKYAPFLKKVDLTYTQYITLMALWEKDGLSVKELGEKLYLDSGTLTPLINGLKSKGLIEKNRDEKDERTVRVFLTEKGTLLKDDALEIPQKISGCIDITPKEAEFLYSVLHKIMGKK